MHGTVGWRKAAPKCHLAFVFMTQHPPPPCGQTSWPPGGASTNPQQPRESLPLPSELLVPGVTTGFSPLLSKRDDVHTSVSPQPLSFHL